MRAGAGVFGGKGDGADREVIISAPWGLLSGPHERKRLTPLSLRKACRGPLCVCVWLAGVCDWWAFLLRSKITYYFPQPINPPHPTTRPSKPHADTKACVCVDKHGCKKVNVTVECSRVFIDASWLNPVQKKVQMIESPVHVCLSWDFLCTNI